MQVALLLCAGMKVLLRLSTMRVIVIRITVKSSVVVTVKEW